MRKFEGYQKGINLGGWLSQCDHTRERYDTFITESDFKDISEKKFDHVRIPVDSDLFENPDGTPREGGMKYLTDAVEWCGKYGLNMILDLHKTVGFVFDDDTDGSLFSDEKLQEKFYEIWEMFAKAFGKYSDRVAFELLNEVTDIEYSDKWNEIASKCIQRVRKYAPDTYILVGGCCNNSISTLRFLEPAADDKIVYNFHFYEPLVFTHQGAYWLKGMPLDFRMTYPDSLENYRTIQHEKTNIISGDLDNVETGTVGEEYFEYKFSEAVRLAEKRNVPLYCGEYGVINLADTKSTLNWIKAVGNTFSKYKIGHALWTYKEMDFGFCDEHLKPISKEMMHCI